MLPLVFYVNMDTFYIYTYINICHLLFAYTNYFCRMHKKYLKCLQRPAWLTDKDEKDIFVLYLFLLIFEM